MTLANYYSSICNNAVTPFFSTPLPPSLFHALDKVLYAVNYPKSLNVPVFGQCVFSVKIHQSKQKYWLRCGNKGIKNKSSAVLK